MASTSTPGLVRALSLTLCLLVTGCGGGGGGGGGSTAPSPAPAPAPSPAPAPPSSGTTPLPALAPTGTGFAVASDAGDPIGGGGKAYAYTQANAGIRVTRTGALLQVQVIGDEVWLGNFVSPRGDAPLINGEYLNLSDGLGSTNANGWQTWGPERLLRNCQVPSGSLKITDVAYVGEQITRLDLEFEQRCGGATGSLRGHLRWDAADPTQPPGPTAIPNELWRAPAGSLPASGNYVHLEGGTGSGLGSGPTLLYAPDNALIGLSAAARRLQFSVRGDLTWFGDVYAMSSRQRIEEGYYPFLLDQQRYNPAKGALGWRQPTESCLGTSRGWVAVDKANYIGDRLQLLEIRFEQRCSETSTKPPLRGQIRWSIDDTRRPPGPQPVPAGVWQPSPALLPGSGSYVYLDSEPGEWVGGGVPLSLLPASQDFVLYESDGKIEVRIGDVGGWSGTFKGPAGWGQPQRGYYGQLLSATFGNPARGGLQWSSPGRGCNDQGWFAIDEVTYSHRVLRSLDLRFQQGCAAAGPVLRGSIHWVSPDPVVALGPVDAVSFPADPPTLQVPNAGSYVLLDSGDDDYIGLGGGYLYTPANAVLRLAYRQGGVDISVLGDQRWDGRFRPPPGQTLGQTASFDQVALRPAAPDVAGMEWSGEARGCDAVQGSWSVQGLRVAGEQVLALDLTFEHYCAGSLSPLRGRVHWEQGGNTVPPGPVSPPPTALWSLPAGLVPTSGNYMYLHSPAGAFVGEGRNRLFTDADTTFAVSSPSDAPLTVTLFDASDRWDLRLAPMSGLNRLEPGYYGDLQRLISQNPARGGMDFGGAARGCNELRGWFVIDSITYDGSAIAAVALRFEMLCEGTSPPIHGQLRWAR